MDLDAAQSSVLSDCVPTFYQYFLLPYHKNEQKPPWDIRQNGCLKSSWNCVTRFMSIGVADYFSLDVRRTIFFHWHSTGTIYE